MKNYNFNSKNLLLAIVLIALAIPSNSNAQIFEDAKEFFTFYPNARAVQQDSTLYPSKFIAAPVISFSPETDFAFGIGAKYLFKFAGSGEETRVSNMPITFQYTLNSQYFLYSGFEIFTNQEKYVITGNILFQNYPRLYFGVGRDTKESAEEVYEYNQLLVEPIFLKQMFDRHLFIGGGLRYNHIYNAEFEEGGLIDNERRDGFDGSTSVGVEVAALYDDRDVILNASEGWYVEFTHGEYGEFLGGTNKFHLTRLDVRHFLKVSDKNDDVLAFQFLGRTVRDDLPFSEYSFFGSSEIMRGYREGRFIDRDLVAAQMEFRKNFKNTRIGAVAFVGTGSVFNNIADFQFGALKPNYGLGIRYKIDKTENLNLRLDWGFGNGSNEIYLGIAEAF